jgi:hypothetical protein
VTGFHRKRQLQGWDIMRFFILKFILHCNAKDMLPVLKLKSLHITSVNLYKMEMKEKSGV